MNQQKAPSAKNSFRLTPEERATLGSEYRAALPTMAVAILCSLFDGQLWLDLVTSCYRVVAHLGTILLRVGAIVLFPVSVPLLTAMYTWRLRSGRIGLSGPPSMNMNWTDPVL